MCQSKNVLCTTAALVLMGLYGGHAGAQVPSTDVWLSELKGSGPELRVGPPENVTRRAGYDNQPCFLPDGKGFLYTRGDSNGTDIYRYDRLQKRFVQITSTPESEYSPTPLRDAGGDFCVVRVESDGAQRLWRFESDGSEPRLVTARVDSVGYFAWLDATIVAMFVVGEPHTLRVVDVATERETVVASDIGRALHRIPERGGLSFLIRDKGSEPASFAFHTWGLDGAPPLHLIDAVGTSQDAAWIGDTLVMSDGTKLYAVRPFETPAWREVADLGAYGLSGITRLSASPDGAWIAIVAAEAP